MKVSYEPTHGMDDWLSETELIPVAGKHIVYVVVKDYLATHDYLVRFVRAKIDFYHGKPELQDNLKPQSVFEIYWNWAHAQWQRGFPFYLSHSSPLFFQYSFVQAIKGAASNLQKQMLKPSRIILVTHVSYQSNEPVLLSTENQWDYTREKYIKPPWRRANW